VKQLVVHITWLHRGEVCTETYGPWTAADDDSHMASIAEFVKAWPRKTGLEPLSVVLALAIDPAAWLAGEVATAASPSKE
jgi:hypothetical protein